MTAVALESSPTESRASDATTDLLWSAMRDATGYTTEFLQLPEAEDARERQLVFRQAMAYLARGAEGPAALGSADPRALDAAVTLALHEKLFDDLEWLDPIGACLALYELTAALAPSPSQRELGRRLLTAVHASDAATFTVVATRMATGSARALLPTSMRARVALVMELPLSYCIDDGPLALAILSRRELLHHWIERASMGSLPWRRFAARILERAAREASFRAAEGEIHALRPFTQEPVASSMARLLADREPLVWRYAAAARGLLSPHVAAFATDIEAALDPKLTPTEWRRAATSLVARGGHVDGELREDLRSESAEAKLTQALTARLLPLLERDRGMAGALVWGLPRTADVDEHAAKRWLDLALRVEPFATAEALCDFLAEYGQGPFTDVAIHATLAATEQVSADNGSLRDALLAEYRHELEQRGRIPGTLRREVFEALDHYAVSGSAAAFEAATTSLAQADVAIRALLDGPASSREGGSSDLRLTASLLRDVSVGMLERNALLDMLRLGTEARQAANDQERFEAMREEIEAWLIERERGHDVRDAAVSLRRVRALLHLADGDTQEEVDDEPRAQRRHARWVRIARTLLQRSMGQPPALLQRVLLAALARTCDGLGRDGDGDVITPFLVLTSCLTDPQAFEILASASTTPDLVRALARYARLVRALASERQADVSKGDSSLPPAIVLAPESTLGGWLEQLHRFALDYVPDLSPQSETLRALLLRLHAALAAVLRASTLQELAQSGGPGSSALDELEACANALRHLTAPALRRFGLVPDDVPARASDSLAVLIERVVARLDPTLQDVTLSARIQTLRRGLPHALAELLSRVVQRLLGLPRDATTRSNRPTALAPLPAWVPARRSIGGFYVLRALGAGAAGSVFLAARIEERHDASAERFALKIPEFTETAARTLTEAQFSRLFREEASALLTLPEHENLARFVTFDAGARPKPILVTEYVEGVTVEQMLHARTLDVARAFVLLDDLLAGLTVLHELGLGHLDVKPSNMIVRDGRTVLVDFGLSGRSLRPGCGTAEYGAPEVWLGVPQEATAATPRAVMAADVYATACVAFELLLGHPLFEASTELALVGKHLAHDGVPPGVLALSRSSKTQELAELLCSALRSDANKRIGSRELREALRRLGRRLEREAWPLTT